MMAVHLIPVGQVASMLPALLPYLKVSEKWTGGRATVDDLLRFILIGQMNLWVVHDDDEVFGHLITEVKQYPQAKFFVVQYCSMKTGTLDDVMDIIQDTAERFAKDAGCVGVEFIGRLGWRAYARKHGYEMQAITYQKMLNGEAS